MIHRLYFLILDQQRGLIWYCSQSWEQISLVKNQYLAFFTLLILLPFLPASTVTFYLIRRTGQQHNLRPVQWKLSLSCIIITPPTHHPSWPSLSFLWVMGSSPSSLVTCKGPSVLSVLPTSLHLAFAFSLCGQLKKTRQKKQWRQRQWPHWFHWLAHAPACFRPVPEARPSPQISTDFPASNKSFSQWAKPLGPRQSRNSTLSAADIKATVKH